MPTTDESKASTPNPARGRPRTEGLDDRVLAATRTAIEQHGYPATTVDQIATASGVSKGSIYRRWPTKGVLVYDACIASGDEIVHVIDSGDIHADLLAVARLTARGYVHGHDVFTFVLADAATDPTLMEMLRTRFFEPRSDRIIRRVELAVERGELRPGIDASLVPAVLNGSQQYVWGVRGRALNEDELVALVGMIVGGHLPH